jgi:hypothetical protein
MNKRRNLGQVPGGKRTDKENERQRQHCARLTAAVNARPRTPSPKIRINLWSLTLSNIPTSLPARIKNK